MEFKQLDIKPEGSWFARNLWSKHSKKTYLFIFLGAAAGVILYFLEGDRQLSNITFNDVLPNILMGGFFGLFITNSPCARNKC